MVRLAAAGFAGAAYGIGLGVCVVIGCAALIGGPVAPVAQITLIYLPTVAGALMGILSAAERA